MSLLPRVCGATVALAILILLLPPTVRDAQAQSSDATQLFPQQGFRSGRLPGDLPGLPYAGRA